MADTQGFFFPDNTPEQAQLLRQQLFAKQLIDGGQSDQATGAYGGLANAGKMLAGALLSKRLGDKAKDLETTREGSYSKALGNFLSPFDYGGAPNTDTGIPDNVNVSPQASAANAGQLGSSMGARLAATGNPDLIRQAAPQLMAQQLQANQPITPYQQAELAQQQRTTDPAYLARVKALPGPLAQAKPQDVIDQENAQADLTAKRNLANEQALKATPGALTPGDSPLAFSQKEQLEKDKALTQMGDANNIEQIAQNIAKYQTAPLSGFAMAKPVGAATMARVTQINPTYNAQNFTKSQQAYKDFGSGKLGSMTRSANVAIAHLSTLDKLNDALGNGNVQAINQLSNTFKEQFGSAAPTNFNAAKAIVGDELVKFITGTGGALADRENAQNQINNAKSPAQLRGVIKTYKDLMTGQLGGLKRQYEQSTMRDDFGSLLSPETVSEIGGNQSGGQGLPAASAPKPAPSFRYDANGNRVSQ